MTKWEIGGEFHLSPQIFYSPDRVDFKNYYDLKPGHYIFFNGGRSAIRYCLQLITRYRPGGTFLLPSYLCETILPPFKESGLNFKFYRVKENLDIDLDDLHARIKGNVRGVFFIHYFGFPQPLEVINYLQELIAREMCVIEDITQSQLTRYKNKFPGYWGSFSVSSFRKFIPIPDGGLLISRKKLPPPENLPGGYDSFSSLRLAAMILKDLYIRKHLQIKKQFLQMFLEAEKYYDSQARPKLMSSLSLNLLHKINWERIIIKRRANFNTLLEHTRNSPHFSPLFDSLPGGVCPLGFPVVVSRSRNHLKKYLIAHNIYPPVHWELPRCIPPVFTDSYKLSSKILTIPCDQRYSREDMLKAAGILTRYPGG